MSLHSHSHLLNPSPELGKCELTYPSPCQHNKCLIWDQNCEKENLRNAKYPFNHSVVSNEFAIHPPTPLPQIRIMFWGKAVKSTCIVTLYTPSQHSHTSSKWLQPSRFLSLPTPPPTIFLSIIIRVTGMNSI